MSSKSRSLLLAGFVTLAFALPAMAQTTEDDRQAGTAMKSVAVAAPVKADAAPKVAAKPVKTKAETTAAKPAPTVKHTDDADDDSSGKGNLAQIESFGTLKTPKDGSFGIDMWDGSDRANIESLIPQVPASFTYRTVRELVRRVLLTNADVTIFDHKDATGGKDLLSLRIEKLMDMGALDDAAALYKDNPLEAYNAKMAATGILAVLYSGQASLACLDTNALKDRFGTSHFWQQMTGLCDYLQAQMTGGKVDSSFQSDSTILQQAMHDKNFRYTIGSVKDFEALTPFEKAVLVDAKRIDYSHASKIEIDQLSPSSLALMARDPSAPLDFRFQLMLSGARLGIFTTADLGVFYKSLTLPPVAADSDKVATYKDIPGWQGLAWLYKSADAAHGIIDHATLLTALPLRSTYGLTALWPFANLLAEADPKGLPGDSIRTGVLLGLATNLPVSKPWLAQWKKIDSTQESNLLVPFAYDISPLPISDTAISSDKLSSDFSNLKPADQKIIKMLYEKLDRNVELHKIDQTKVYEKTVDLTGDAGYVMPSKGLIDSLKVAENDKRLGEVILLSSIALHGVPTADINADLLREAIDGFETVGLTKESREFATEAILGLSK